MGRTKLHQTVKPAVKNKTEQTVKSALKGGKIMGDKYTVYPERLRKQIEKVDKMFADDAKEREWWDSLTPEQQQAETKKRELLDSWWNALSPEDQARFEALSPEEKEKEMEGVLHAHGHEPIEAPISQHEPEPETVEALKAKLEKAEQQLRSLQGKYEKEPAEMQRQNNFLQDQVALLQRQITDLQTHPVKKEPEPEKKIVFREVMKNRIEKLKEQLAPEIVEEIVSFNEEAFELVQKADREVAAQMITEVATKVDTRLALTAKETFDKDLIEAYPNWKTMWKTPEFQTWLSVIPDDDLSGVDRYAHIDEAFQRFDSRKVIKAFDLFTGKRPELKRDTKIDENKLKNRVVGPRSSSPGGIIPTKQTNKITPQEAREALKALSSRYARGLFKGSREEYDKEYAKLHALCEDKAPPG